MAQCGIEWKFNPPSAPHFGGIRESAVKAAKHHLSRMLTETKLHFGELNTLLCQVEACLTSRPITPMSSDPKDFEALTTAHFLIGGSIHMSPEPDMPDTAPCITRRWKYVQFLMHTFWNRWRLEYLPQYQVRGKWTARKPPLEINNIVIIKEECIAPTRWKSGKVVQMHPGKDGVVRVVTVRLASGSEIRRPTVKLCVLPTEADIDLAEN